ncbi:MAG: hypothetical protein VX684_12245, partial [Planctomycetota bacterium]|nr:hypothetical protein [Planctomycetota bacterium]
AVRVDGSIACWGDDSQGQCTVPAGLGTVLDVDAGLFHTVARTSEGAVACWGSDAFGQSTVPPELGPVSAIAAGARHTLVLAGGADPAVVGWGSNTSAQLEVPSALEGVVLVGVAAGSGHSVVLDETGQVHAWGTDSAGQVSGVDGYAPAIAVSAGGAATLLLVPDCASDPGAPGCGCLGDLDADGAVGGGDLTLLLAAWGRAEPGVDLDGDGFIGGADLTLLLSRWGACTTP